MKNEIKLHLERVLTHYTSGSHYERLLEAKDEYFNLTGQVNEDDEDYELRMNSFNDWYIFQFVSKRSSRAAIFDYVEEHELDEALSNSLKGMNYSLFEYCGKTFRGFCGFKDVLHNYKFVLPKESNPPGLLKEDIFIGRTIKWEDNHYLLAGLCLLPKEIRGKLRKQSKKLRKLNDIKQETDFLLKVESLKTKWVRYGHIEPDRIFSFEL
ncbi:MAG: hypothetical protein VXY34_10405 [Bdellovibrionota bacterium]|nr:hypothetical protein [Bdellovibrionota bacterium]